MAHSSWVEEGSADGATKIEIDDDDGYYSFSNSRVRLVGALGGWL